MNLGFTLGEGQFFALLALLQLSREKYAFHGIPESPHLRELREEMESRINPKPNETP